MYSLRIQRQANCSSKTQIFLILFFSFWGLFSFFYFSKRCGNFRFSKVSLGMLSKRMGVKCVTSFREGFGLFWNLQLKLPAQFFHTIIIYRKICFYLIFCCSWLSAVAAQNATPYHRTCKRPTSKILQLSWNFWTCHGKNCNNYVIPLKYPYITWLMQIFHRINDKKILFC